MTIYSRLRNEDRLDVKQQMGNENFLIPYLNCIMVIISEDLPRPQLMCDYPLNLSILIRGGKETKWDSLSSGERNGISPARRVACLIVC